jgi:hypothetical protein
MDPAKEELLRAAAQELIASVELKIKSISFNFIRKEVAFISLQLSQSNIDVLVRGDGGIGVRVRITPLPFLSKLVFSTFCDDRVHLVH